MPARKHHYVPQFYQKGFASADGLLWVYDRKLHIYKRLAPKVICRSENLYTVKVQPGVNDTTIETEILSPIEGAAAPVIRSLKDGYKPPALEFASLIVFISLQFTRLPSFSRAVSQTLEALRRERIIYQFGEPGRAAEALQELGSQLTPEQAIEMVDDLRQRRITINATEAGFLRMMFHHAQTLGMWLHDTDWTIMVAPTSTGFIICDHPFTSVPAQGSKLISSGWGLPGITVYFPLTRRLCLRAKAGDYGYRYTQVESRTVRTVNLNIAANSDRFVMGSNETQIKAIIERSRSVDVEPGERFSITHDQETRILRFVMQPRRYFY